MVGCLGSLIGTAMVLVGIALWQPWRPWTVVLIVVGIILPTVSWTFYVGRKVRQQAKRDVEKEYRKFGDEDYPCEDIINPN